MNDSTEKLLNENSNLVHFQNGIANPTEVDDEITNYFSRLSPETIRQLDDFVQITDHTSVPTFNFNFDTSSSSNYFARNGLQRPVTMYEQSYEQEYSSLPPDVISNSVTNKLPDTNRYAWEAEDADYIETLDESREVYECDYEGSLISSTQNNYEIIHQPRMQW